MSAFGSSGGKVDKKAEKIRKEAQEMINGAKALQVKGNKEKAAAEYRRVIRFLRNESENVRKNPQLFSGIYTEVAQGFYGLDETDHALETVEKALTLDENNIDAWRLKASIYVSMNTMNEYALLCLDHVLKLKPDDKKALVQKANVLRVVGRENEALKVYETLIDKDPANAMKYLDRMLKIKPDDPKIWIKKGKALLKVKDKKGALEAFKKAYALEPNDKLADIIMKMDPDSPDLLIKKGEKLEKEGKLLEAAEIYAQIIEKDPSKIELLDRIIEKEPENPELLYRKAVFLERSGNADAAVEIYEKLLEIDPGNLSYYDKMLKYRPDDPDILLAKAEALYSKDRFEEALPIFEKMVELYPDDDTMWYNLGANLMAMGRYEDAIKAFNEVTKRNQDDVMTWLSKGICFYKTGKVDIAINSFNQVIRRDPSMDLGWYYKAKLEAIKGENPQLIKTFLKRAVELNPDNKEKAKEDEDIMKYSNQLGEILG